MHEQFVAALGLLREYLSQHVVICAAALLLGIALSLPLALLATRVARLRWPILSLARLVQTIPGLALLAAFYPLLLALSALTNSAFGVAIPALGFLPTLLALTLYAMLPILQNSVTGLTGIDLAVLEAADGVGMTARQRLLRIEIPLAAPVIMAGIRTASVWTIGAATLSTTVGQTSLGNYIFSGLQTENWVFVLFGCVSAAGLALLTDQILALVEAGLTRRDMRRLGVGLALVVLGIAGAHVSLTGAEARTYTIGAKNFSEQFILSELIGQCLQHEGYNVRRKDGLGSAVAFRALAGSDIDVYVDYSGTLWTNVMKREDAPARDAMIGEITHWMLEHHGIVVLGPLGFENAYALAMRRGRAQALNIHSIEDLAARASGLSFGSDLEFLSRPEWTSLQKTYGLDFASARSFTPTFMYRAVGDGAVDVISAFSSDGRIAAQDLLVLSDPKHAIPNYDALILIAPRRAKDEALRRALVPLIGAIGVDKMRAANYAVDRDNEKVSPAGAARLLLDCTRNR